MVGKELTTEQIKSLRKKRLPVYWLVWFSEPGQDKGSGRRQVQVETEFGRTVAPSGETPIDDYAFANIQDLMETDRLLWRNWKQISHYAEREKIRKVRFEN